MPPQLRVALVNRMDTEDVSVLSGSPHFMTKALERQSVSVTALGPISSTWMALGRYANGVARLAHRRYDWTHSMAGARELGRKFTARLSSSDFDLVFAPVASTEIAYLETSLPIIYLTDMTLKAATSYYGAFTNLLPFSAAEGERIEKLAIQRAARIVVPSKWAARSFHEDYHCAADDVEIVPFGANLDDPPSRAEALRERSLETCRLLLLGVSWERKGGSMALKILESLLNSGIKTELVVCGCKPPAGVSHPSMRVLPFLKKSDPTQARQLRELVLSSTFVLLPSKAEAWGVVLCEASACGVPSVARATGGIPGAVRNGVNGFCLPEDADAQHYADEIAHLMRNPAGYRSLQVSSRDEYETRLNWDVWAARMVEIFTSVRSTAARIAALAAQ